MAAKKTTEVVETIEKEEPIMTPPTGKKYWEEKIPYKLPFDRNNSDDVFVAVNGKNFVIKRGQEVMIPRNVAAVLDQSQEQDYATWRKTKELEDKYIAEAKKRGV